MKEKRGQVWVETVIYTLIAFVMIGLVLSYAKPKIEELQDKAIIEQSVGVMEDINSIILSIAQGGAGNTRLIKLDLKEGVLEIDGMKDKIVFEMESKHTYSQPGELINVGGITVYTEEMGRFNLVTLTSDYSEEYDLKYQEKDELGSISKVSTPCNLLISNKGRDGDKIIIDLSN